ncbi:MAG: VIT1/CCC1 transporter family protein [Oscillospiraceae bacterium]|nr:VIT1/CCC1 transporter family protein [Oscillospiraceae bacterium]MDD4367545.1 VIT1/CCC1 transporter family protein [Oscillospiraceae bacterium]
MRQTNRKDWVKIQRAEAEGAALYRAVAGQVKHKQDRATLLAIAAEEERHAAVFAAHTGSSIQLNRFKMTCYRLLARVLGYTFALKWLEGGEDKTIACYQANLETFPELKQIIAEEEQHEQKLISILDEERLHYVGDMVLGMNDALVELTGALAGYTLAMQNTQVIAMAGLITGVSATLSMTASGYLSSREAGNKNARRSALYTGAAYLLTVAILILPFLLMPAPAYLGALCLTLLLAVLIIAAFNYYISVAKGRPFRKNFLTMVGISLGVACISFGIGLLVKQVLGIDL